MATNNSWNSQDPVQVTLGGTGVSTLTTAYGLLCAGTTATNPVQTLSSLGNSGQVLASQGASSLPHWISLPGSDTWVNVTGSTQALAINTGYYTTYAGTSVMTLPSTAAAGSIIEITNVSGTAAGWQIAQNASGYIQFGSVVTTTGTGGSITATAIGDSIRLLCVVANNGWVVLSSVGNITYVGTP